MKQLSEQLYKKKKTGKNPVGRVLIQSHLPRPFTLPFSRSKDIYESDIHFLCIKQKNHYQKFFVALKSHPAYCAPWYTIQGPVCRLA